MRRRLAVLASVFRNPALRRVAGAFLAFSIGEWATWVAVIVYAYGRGGAAEAGFVAFIQLVPSVVMAPAAGTLGDRFSRKRVLLTAYVLQTGAMAAAALALATGAPAPVVYALATLTATAITMTRPVQSALLPDVATTPDQLTAANVASGTIEGAGHCSGRRSRACSPPSADRPSYSRFRRSACSWRRSRSCRSPGATSAVGTRQVTQKASRSAACCRAGSPRSPRIRGSAASWPSSLRRPC